MVQYRIDLIVDGRKVKEVTRDFDSQEKSIDKLSKSFAGMEKVSLAMTAAQLKMVGNVSTLSGVMQKNLIGPVMKLGASFAEVEKLSKRKLKTDQGTKWMQTRLANILSNDIVPATKSLVSIQGANEKKIQKTGKGLKDTFKTIKNIKVMAAGIGLTSLFAFGAASPLLQARLSMLGFQFEQLSIIIGDSLAPIIEVLSMGVQGLIDLWNNLSPPVQATIKHLILVTAVVLALSLAVSLLSGVMGILGVVSLPVAVIILAIAAALAVLFLAWETNFGGFRDHAIAGFEELLAGFDTFLDGLEKMAKGDFMEGFIEVFVGGLRFAVEYALTIPKILVNTFGKAFDDITRGIFKPFLDVLGAVGAIIEGIVTLDVGKIERGMREVEIALGIRKESFRAVDITATRGRYGFVGQAGGIVPGSTGAPVPSLIHGGEMVLNRGQQQGLFNMLNGGGTNITNNNQRSSNFNINISIDSGGNMGSETAEELRNSLIGRISSL